MNPKQPYKKLVLTFLIVLFVFELSVTTSSAQKFNNRDVPGSQFQGKYYSTDGNIEYRFPNNMNFVFAANGETDLDIDLDPTLNNANFGVTLDSQTSPVTFKLMGNKNFAKPPTGKSYYWKRGSNMHTTSLFQQNNDDISQLEISLYKSIYFTMEISESVESFVYYLELDSSSTSVSWAYFNTEFQAWYLLESSLDDNTLYLNVSREDYPLLFSSDQITIAPVSFETTPSTPFEYLLMNWWILVILVVMMVFGLLMSNQDYRNYLLNRSIYVNKGVHENMSMEDVLENQNRSKIIDLILNNPGIHFNQLLNESQISAGTLAWHLDILETFLIIRKIRVGQYLTYYLYLDKNPLSTLDFQLKKSKTTLEILQLINDNPGIYQNNIAHRLEISHKTVKYHIDKLIEADAIREDGKKRKKGYFSNISVKLD